MSKREKIAVIVKKPGEFPGKMKHVNNELKAFQEIVDGYLEVVPLRNGSDVIIVNEEGKIRDCKFNFTMLDFIDDQIFGTVIVAGVDKDGNMTEPSISLDEWARLLCDWGN